MFKDHEKFWAFSLLLGSIVGIVVVVLFHPIPEGSGSQRIVDAAIGGLLLAFGGAANALFRISNSTEQAAIGEATAKAIEARGPTETTVVNPPNESVPTSDTPIPPPPQPV